MLEKIKILLGIYNDDKDELINELIEMTKEEVKEYCGIDSDTQLESLFGTIKEIVVIKYNRLGTEGLASENYSGASFGYMTDYPESIKNALNKNRRAKLL